MKVAQKEAFLLFLATMVLILSFCVEARLLNDVKVKNTRSEEAARRLRRGFQSSSLATARGFGKRSNNYGTFPFSNNRHEDFSAYIKPEQQLLSKLIKMDRSEAARRLRRGLQGSSLATARGFGKRSSNYGSIPFEINTPDEPLINLKSDEQQMGKLIITERYPTDLIVQLARKDPGFASAIVDKLLDINEDGWISAKELERLQ